MKAKSCNEDKNSLSGVEPLWTVKEVAEFLRRSKRWVWSALNVEADQAGSIPHMRLNNSPRFCPRIIQAWAEAGFPTAAVFKAMNSKRKDSR